MLCWHTLCGRRPSGSPSSARFLSRLPPRRLPRPRVSNRILLQSVSFDSYTLSPLLLAPSSPPLSASNGTLSGPLLNPFLPMLWKLFTMLLKKVHTSCEVRSFNWSQGKQQPVRRCTGMTHHQSTLQADQGRAHRPARPPMLHPAACQPALQSGEVGLWNVPFCSWTASWAEPQFGDSPAMSEPGEAGGESGRTGVSPAPPRAPPMALSVRISRSELLACSLLPAPKSSRRV